METSESISPQPNENTAAIDDGYQHNTVESKTQPQTPLVPEGDLKIQSALDKNEGIIVTDSGIKLAFTRSHDTPMFINRAKLILRSLANNPPLPTQILFNKQAPEALDLVGRYIEGIKNIFQGVELYGLKTNVDSYAFRLPHLLKEMEWVDVVVRLQFATSLYAIYETLNGNLSKEAKNKWGVLEYKDGIYTIDGTEIKFGDRIDVFTVNEKIIADVEFNSQEVLNCRPINGTTLPVFNIPADEIENIDFESMKKREANGVKGKDHLIGVDAWSFLHGLLYRISGDGEDIIDINTEILSKRDLDPAIKHQDYNMIGELLTDKDLPFGLNHGILTGLRDYYCKSNKVFYGFAKNVKALYDNPESFRKQLSNQGLGNSFVIDNIHSLTLLLDGKSKLLRVKLVMFDGSTKDAVAITRPLSMSNLGAFARFNPRPMYFQEIKYKQKENSKRGFMDRLRGINQYENIGLDHFDLVEGNPIESENVIGFITGSAKAYYFGEDSTIELDDKFAFFHQLRKSFKLWEQSEIK